ncbi:uncharacterized protein TNCT_674131 [Trichonephila clavata]|uniref:Uncharacterized protein n=1 Tax=Trichonephila clavata TaxID=2740835 RepID=A0A8X6KCA6_TRICU|nr:uncharacterized protein TNCT_674131 [Trichonephila clavata]
MIFTVFLISRSTHTKMKVQRMSHPLIHPLQHNRLPPASSFKMVKAMRYCNPPNDIAQGQEGRFCSQLLLSLYYEITLSL